MTEGDLAADYAQHLLRQRVDIPPMDHPALSWRRAGLMDVTGAARGLMSPAALSAAADGALAALRVLAPDATLPRSGALLLGERTRLRGLVRAGTTSTGGACRVLPTRDGAVALSLTRPEDFAALPALLEADVALAWPDLSAHDSAGLVQRGRLLGLAISPVQPPHAPPLPPPAGMRGSRRGVPRVLDMSSLWAGPLAGSLLAACGARVIKLESTTRQDGARAGHPIFYDLLNWQKSSVAVDFSSYPGRAALRRLIHGADIIIASARPRVWLQLGIDPAAEAARGAIFVSITGHADGSPAFGDDAGTAAGLNALMAAHWGQPYFAGDAIADPLTGIHAALYTWAAWQAGGGQYITLPLSGVVAQILAWDSGISPTRTRAWQTLAEADTAPLYGMRTAPPAPAMGADTETVLAAC